MTVWMTAGFSTDEIARHLGTTCDDVASELARVAKIVGELRTSGRREATGGLGSDPLPPGPLKL